MIGRFVQILAQGSKLSAEEILDVLWLAATKSASETDSLAPAGTVPEGSAPESDSANDAGVPVPADGGRASGTDAEVPLHLGGDLPGADDENASPPVPATEVAFGAPRPIRDPLTLPVALRRLRRISAPGPVVTVDIDATVEATAEAGGRLMTVLTRPPERALDLALVIDGAPSMDIWAGTFDELERLLAQTGAFRSVSRWTLRLSGDAAQLESRDGRAQPPRRLTDPSGRRLVLLATDGRDEAWYSAAPWDTLDAWCAAMPTALLQVLPQHYWATTAVGDPYLTATAMRPAAPNSQYVRRLAWWADDPGGVPLPVVTLSPRAMETWAQVVAGGTTWATGITAVPPAPDSAPSAGDGTDPLMLVNDFRSRASSGAQRLARILASTETLSMPLIEVLQDQLAPETGVLERAEVLASGMLALNWTADGQTLFRYRPGIPEILRRGVTTFEEWDTYAAVSQYLEDRHRLGGPLHALAADPAGTAKLDAAESPFAALRENLAVRLGLRDAAANRTASFATSGPSESADQDRGEAEHVVRGEAGSPLLDEEGDVLLSEAAVDVHEEVDLRGHVQDANFEATVGEEEPVTASDRPVLQGRDVVNPTFVTRTGVVGVPRPLVQHSLLSAAAASLAGGPGGPGGQGLAREFDLALLAAAIVCGGTPLLVDPTVAPETLERSRAAAAALGLELEVPQRPRPEEIAEASARGGALLRRVEDRTKDLGPDAAHHQDAALWEPAPTGLGLPDRGRELTGRHLDLVSAFKSRFGDSSRSGEFDLKAAARWLCEPGQDEAWGNKMLAGLCGFDEEDGNSDLLGSYLARLEDQYHDGIAESYWYTNALIGRFRSGYLPAIAGKLGGLYFTQDMSALSDHVGFFTELATQALDRRPQELDDGRAADAIARHAMAWAATEAILDPQWGPGNPVGLIEAAKRRHEDRGIRRLMTRAYELGSGQVRDDAAREDHVRQEVTDLMAKYARHVNRDNARANNLVIAGLAAVASVGAALVSAPLANHLAGGFGFAASLASQRLSARRPLDVSAATLRFDALSAQSRTDVQAKLSQLNVRPAPRGTSSLPHVGWKGWRVQCRGIRRAMT